MKLSRPDADIFVPDGTPMPEALRRATHVCIGAHPDDQEFMAFHGIAACFSRRARGFAGVILTDGGGCARSGPYAGCDDAEMVRVRALEQRKAAFVGEYACQIQLGHPSAHVKAPAHEGVRADLDAILAEVRPEVLYLHNPADRHDTHVAACLRAIEAVRRLPRDRRPPRVLGCEVWRGLDWLVPGDKHVLPVGQPANLASALCALFDSQISGGKRYDAAVAGRRAANATFLESHATDAPGASGAVDFAVDLTPLAQDDAIPVLEFARGLVRRLEEDVVERIRKLSTP